MDFVGPAEDKVKMKECEKWDKYIDLAGELKKPKKQWNMKVTVIPIVVD